MRPTRRRLLQAVRRITRTKRASRHHKKPQFFSSARLRMLRSARSARRNMSRSARTPQHSSSKRFSSPPNPGGLYSGTEARAGAKCALPGAVCCRRYAGSGARKAFHGIKRNRSSSVPHVCGCSGQDSLLTCLSRNHLPQHIEAIRDNALTRIMKMATRATHGRSTV